jgi:glycosyltransferase involved in cell wall biosynthesis
VSRRRALVCAYDPPRFDRDSGARRIFHLIELLREFGWDVCFVAANGIYDMRYVHALEERRVLVHDASTTPLDGVVAEGQFDVAIFAFWQLAELYLPLIRRLSPPTRVIVDSIDLQFVRDARRTLKDVDLYGSPGLLGEDFGDAFVGELNAYAAADAVLAVSSKEAELINDLAGDPTLAFPVHDHEEYQRSPVPFSQRRGIAFVGSFRHVPNIEAVEYFCREVIPRLDRKLLRQHPVTIIGDGVDDLVRSHASGIPDVAMVGWVPALEPYFEHSRISVVPLLYGAGTKRKMIQALLLGTPTVSTGIGAEGLGLVSGEHALVADDAPSFAAAIEELLTDAELWEHIAQEGRAHVASEHGRDAVRAQLTTVLETTLGRPVKPSLLTDLGEERYRRRQHYGHHLARMPYVRDAVRRFVPPDAVIAIATDGWASSELLRIEGRKTWLVPESSDWPATKVPATGEEALAALLDARERGASFLLMPATALWWRHRYPEVTEYLDDRCTLVSEDEDCLLFALEGAEPGAPPAVEVDERIEAPALLTPDAPHDLPARLLAFFLPQFHPIPENDGWWGQGFTEWTNVARAQPFFEGHYQPRIPSDLGYYDLRLPETRAAQAELARTHGIHGFCYYHYWFSGKQLLERPFQEVRESGAPDFPFCLCWANEPWSRRWDGSEHDILQPQSYSAEDDLDHIRWLLPALADPRAIAIGGRPIFIVYQARELPDPAATAELWRREVESAGLPGIYLIAVETGWDAGWDATQVGFDAKVLFQPQFSLLRTVPQIHVPEHPELLVYDYDQAWPVLANPEPVSYRRYDTVFPSWDNSARKGGQGVVVHAATPESYEEWLRYAIGRAQAQPPDERIVFLNAWNEWAEGCHLEPDQVHGRAYLEATRRALATFADFGARR